VLVQTQRGHGNGKRAREKVLWPTSCFYEFS
jgi:hypothetical protein